MLKNFVPRLYQETILGTCVQKNTLVVLPTGMGKTGIALLLAAQRLKQYPQSKILFLAPTKPLAEQHLQTFKQHIEFAEEKITLFTGDITPEKRAKLWQDVQIIFSTPQGLENDIINNTIKLEDVSLLVFDEAHRATGDYSYVFIAKQYNKKANYPKILALTASPGNDLQTIEDVCKNLFVEEVEIRTDKDPDVQPYIQPIDITTIKVELPEDFKQIIKILEQCIKTKISEIKQYGIQDINTQSKKELLLLQGRLQAEIAKGQADFATMKTISILAEIMKVQHALELAESQGITMLHKYCQKIFEEAQTSKTKAVQNLAKDLHFKTAAIKTQKLFEQKIEHPKLAEVRKIVENEVSQNKFVKILLFTQFRESAVKISEEITTIPNMVPSIFVGQTKKGETGLSQKKQIEMLQQFKDGLFNILICTSVAEEGLDIPKVDLVMFYEPVPSAIRSIQRRGRTGRQDKGRVIMLITKGTRDEAYNWSSKQKEKKMQYFLTQLKTTMKGKLQKTTQPTLAKFVSDDKKLKIFADYREKNSSTIKTLIDANVELKLEMLNCADYILSERCAVELKKVQDFVDSLIDGRLLQQLKTLKQSYYKPLIIIEGEQDIYSVRNVHPNAIRGMLATIAVSYGIPTLQTKNEEETAALLLAIAKREQDDTAKEFSLHADKKPLTISEQQEYIVSALPTVGPSLAKELLKQFKTVKNIVNASHEELQKIEGVGEKISKRIKETVEAEYKNG